MTIKTTYKALWPQPPMDDREPNSKNTYNADDMSTCDCPHTLVVGEYIGGFHVKRVIATGGMGVVYEATQANPRRTVALKIMKRGMTSRSALRRFQYEAQILARLRHPGIAEIYQAGIHEEEVPGYGRIEEPYFSMEYIPNAKTIVEYAHANSMSTHDRLDLFVKVCEAVHHGHQKGIIHRDLKPSNILVDSSGQPKVIDFGVARSTDSDMAVTTLQTDVGKLIGTLQYMSPEQCDADPHDLDTRSDVYSLGVILYELLCNQLPYDISGTAVYEAARRIREESPPKPSTINRMLRGDVETILMKSQDKDRNRRYQSAAELAQDIRRYLNSEPIVAHPPSLAYQVRMFARRHRTVFFALAVVLMTLVLATVTSVVFAIRAERARDSEKRQRVAAENAEREAENARDAAEHAKQKAVAALEDLQRAGYIANVRLADHYIKTNYAFMAKDALDKCHEGYRNWEWDYLNSIMDTSTLTLRGHSHNASAVAVSPDGKWIVSGYRDQTIVIWDAESGEELRTLRGHTGWVTSVVVSPDGKQIVSGSLDRTVRIWDVASGDELRILRGHEGGVESVAVSPDGKRIISGGGRGDRTVRIWDAASGNELKSLVGHTDGVRAVAVRPDGKQVISGSPDRTIRIWDAETGQELKTLKGHRRGIQSMVVSPDGRQIVSGGEDHTVRIWDAETGEEVRTLAGHESWVMCVAVSPDGERIVSGDGDNCTIKIWDAETGDEVRTLRGHESWVLAVAVSPDGKRIISGGDNTVRIWDAESDPARRTLTGHRGTIISVAFSADGRHIISGASDKTVKIWDAESGKEQMTLRGHQGIVCSVVADPDGKRIISGASDNTVKVWNAESGEELRTLSGHQGRVSAVAIDPDGKYMASGAWDGVVKVWEGESAKELRTLTGRLDAPVLSIAFSPDGERLIAGSAGDYSIRIWDVQSGEELRTLSGHQGQVNAVAFSRNGGRLVSGAWDKTIKIWDAESGEELRTLRGHGGAISSLAVSPDDKRIISVSSWDYTIKIWDVESGEELMSLCKYEKGARSVAVSPDGSTIVSGNGDGTIFVWRIQSGGRD